jgi:hypothetical protein
MHAGSPGTRPALPTKAWRGVRALAGRVDEHAGKPLMT